MYRASESVTGICLRLDRQSRSHSDAFPSCSSPKIQTRAGRNAVKVDSSAREIEWLNVSECPARDNLEKKLAAQLAWGSSRRQLC